MKHLLKLILLTPLLLIFIVPLHGQDSKTNNNGATPEDRPRLVVGIVVDQMRYEYIPRFWSKYGEDGFKRLVNDGYSFTNNHYNYFPTYTGPGHAAIYTGTTPSVNGIVGNSWYQRRDKAGMYVVSDTTVQSVGAKSDTRSPANLLSSTVTDELKKGITQSKVVGVSIKDRGAVLPAGHMADGAYWYDGGSGKFITSTWYKQELPAWVNDFNDQQWPQKYSKKTWNPLLDLDKYTESNKDNSPYEDAFGDSQQPVFPHSMNGSLNRIKGSPFGNALLAKMAKASVEGEQLGSDEVTDFLAVSFSSTDYVGHRFGPNSIEVEDTYLRLDKTLGDLLAYLDKTVGEGEYVVFLTADHGAVDVPASLTDNGMPGGYFHSRPVLDSLDTFLNNKYGDAQWIESYTNQQVYLDRNLIREKELSLENIQQQAARFLEQFEGVASTNTASKLQKEGYSDGLQAMYQRGYYAERSGDVYIQLAPGWMDRTSEVGTSHGSPYSYDTHVPLLFYGWNIPQGSSSKKTVIPQIAPTISNMLQIEFPNGSRNKVLQFE